MRTLRNMSPSLTMNCLSHGSTSHSGLPREVRNAFALRESFAIRPDKRIRHFRTGMPLASPDEFRAKARRMVVATTKALGAYAGHVPLAASRYAKHYRAVGLAERAEAVGDSVLRVFARTAPFKVFWSVVRLHAVLVVYAVLAFRWVAKEGQCYQSVDLDIPSASALSADADYAVAVRVASLRQKRAMDSCNTTVTRHSIARIYRALAPLFRRGIFSLSHDGLLTEISGQSRWGASNTLAARCHFITEAA